ncbi:MAG: hypothetical protein J6N72_02275 [Psychrobacter sp.]|nr:hypothetical protein [Psychrobacter sp.]
MFTININDLNQVINAKDVVKEADNLTEKKALNCTKYGCITIAIAIIVGLVVAAVVGIEITGTLIGWSIIPLSAAVGIRIAYIKTLYYDNLVLTAIKRKNRMVLEAIHSANA